MAYTSSDANGRITGGYIIISGEYVKLSEYAERLGFSTWDEFVAVNPIQLGRVEISEVVNKSGEIAFAGEHPDPIIFKRKDVIGSGSNEIQGQPGRSLPGELSPQPGTGIDDIPILPGELSPVQGNGRSIQPNPIPENSIRYLGGSQYFDESTGKYTGGPNYKQDQGEGRQLFAETPAEQTRNAFVSQINRDSLAGGNITDIFKNYLVGE